MTPIHSLRLLCLLLGGLTAWSATIDPQALTETIGHRLRQERAIRDSYEAATATQRQELLRQLARGPNHQAIELAMNLARRDGPATQAALLEAIPARAEAIPQRQAIRDLARSSDPQVAQAAHGALARLEDHHAIPLLISDLSNHDEQVAQSARAALADLTGVDRGADPSQWRTWQRQREHRLAKQLPGLTAQLESPNPRDVGRAVHQLLQLGHDRSLVIELLEPLLEDPDPGIARLVQDAMERMSGPYAAHVLKQHRPEHLIAARQAISESGPQASTGPAQAAGRARAASSSGTLWWFWTLLGTTLAVAGVFFNRSRQHERTPPQTARPERKRTQITFSGE